jgi:hypothetical protein
MEKASEPPPTPVPPAGNQNAMARRIRKQYLAGIRVCHANLLRRSPSAQGKVTVRLTIQASGKVSTVQVIGFHPEIESCIARRALGWSFPEAQRDGELVIPFILQSS